VVQSALESSILVETTRAGILLTLGAYVVWGLSPVYWKLVVDIPASQLVAHRIVWCALMLAVLVAVERRGRELARVFTSPRVVLTLLATTALIATNWLVYIWAVVNERILEASLGYFINPLVTVLLAVVILGERLSRGRWISMLLAGLGVTLLAWRVGELPWIALVLAFTFGFYGLLRKTVRADPEVGLLVETSLLAPWMLLLLERAAASGVGAFGHRGVGTDLLLVASGAVTAVPLLLFTHGARRLALSTVGFLQYVAPSLQFLLAVGVYGETFTLDHLGAFLLIWAALGLFSWEARPRRRGPLNPAAGSTARGR
jgi:chloramphenicol-sensitive protein RarD